MAYIELWPYPRRASSTPPRGAKNTKELFEPFARPYLNKRFYLRFYEDLSITLGLNLVSFHIFGSLYKPIQPNYLVCVKGNHMPNYGKETPEMC